LQLPLLPSSAFVEPGGRQSVSCTIKSGFGVIKHHFLDIWLCRLAAEYIQIAIGLGFRQMKEFLR